MPFECSFLFKCDLYLNSGRERYLCRYADPQHQEGQGGARAHAQVEGGAAAEANEEGRGGERRHGGAQGEGQAGVGGLVQEVRDTAGEDQVLQQGGGDQVRDRRDERHRAGYRVGEGLQALRLQFQGKIRFLCSFV